MFFEIEKKLKSVAKAMAAFGVLAAIAASRGASVNSGDFLLVLG